MNRFRSIAAGAVVATLLMGGAALAQGPRPGGGRGFGGPQHAGLPMRQLDLTEAQREQIRAIHEQSREAGRATAGRVREAMLAQRKAVETVPVDEGLIRSTTQGLAEAQSEAAIHEARVFSQVWAILTPDQQAKAKELRAEREKRMAERRQQLQQRHQQRNQ